MTELAAKQIENGETSSQKVLGEGVTLQTQAVMVLMNDFALK